jgi:hypothetical protein
MLKFIITLVLICSLFFKNLDSVSAQSPTSSPTIPVAKLDLDSIADQLTAINKSNLPFGVNFGDNVLGTSTDITASQPAVLNQASSIASDKSSLSAAHQYSISSSRCTPQEETTDSQNVLQKVFAFFKDLFSFGNKKAYESLGCLVPQGTIEGEKAYVPDTDLISQQEVSDDNVNVLGIFNKKTDMENSLPRMRCSELPYGAMDCPGIK